MVFVNDGGFKVQTYTIFLKLNRNGTAGSTAATLNNRNRELAPGEETRDLSVHRDQVWFGQRSKGAVGLHGANHLCGIATHQEDVHGGREGSLHDPVCDLAECAWTNTTNKPSRTWT